MSEAWLNLDVVRSALHVGLEAESGAFAFSTNLNYSFTAYSLLDLYNDTLVPALRILQFSGDADPCVPYMGTSRWIESLAMPVVAPWRPWSSDNAKFAGYVTTYGPERCGDGIADDMNGTGCFTFATVRDAGHMVPRYKGQEALEMITRFLANEHLPSNRPELP